MPMMSIRMLLCAMVLLPGALSMRLASAAEIVVTSTTAEGPGSLGEAITQANNATEETTITFNLGGDMTIRPNVQLPTIVSNHPVTINGGNTVVLSGENTTTNAIGIGIGSDDVTIRGVTIVRFPTGIYIAGVDTVVENCRIGTDGVSVFQDNTLGNEDGIVVAPSAQYTRIGGIGAGNVISGNTSVGIFFDDTFDIRIIGNFIGLNAAGTIGIPNFGNGIRGLDSTLVRIGGAEEGAANYIAGNTNSAISLVRMTDAVIEGNVIGLNFARTMLIANTGGIFYSLDSGSGSAIRGNILCGSGIALRSTSNFIIENNYLGVNGMGAVPFLSSGTGIIVDNVGGSSANIVIGGEGAENVIANFQNFGIELFGAGTDRIRITRNAIHSNNNGGMQFSGGANNTISPPTISGINPVAGMAQGNDRIEFFADNGNQGQFYLGSVLADAIGNFSTMALDLGPHAGRNLTATATDLDGNTSPFSAPFAIPGGSDAHSADQDSNNVISLSELLRVIQFFNTGGLHCAASPGATEDGFVPGVNASAQSCAPHASDYNPQNWVISLSELLRLIQFFNSGGYFACESGEDGYCPGSE